MNVVSDAGRDTSPTDPESPEALGLVVDTQIMRLLGLRFEIQDDIIKVWPRDVVPDETNWLVGTRFSLSLAESMNVLDGLGVTVEFFEEDGWHWADVIFGEEGELQTQEAPTKELAGAFACCAALYGRSGGKSCVT
jgi:hypothetical protein